MATFVLLAPTGSVRVAPDHMRMKKSGSVAKEVVQGGPFPQKGASCLERRACFAMIVLQRTESVLYAAARAVRRLYRPPHVAASSAPLGC